MKLWSCLGATLLLVFSDAARSPRHALSLRGTGGGALRRSNGTDVQSAARAALGKSVAAHLNWEAPQPLQVRAAIKEGLGKMSMEEAVRQVAQQLPPSGALGSLARLGGGPMSIQGSDAKAARDVLNGMILKALAELDDALFLSQEIIQRNRETYAQVLVDMSRLGSSLAHLSAVRMVAVAGGADYDQQRRRVEDSLEHTRVSYELTQKARTETLMARRASLEALDYVLKITSCGASGDGSLLQTAQTPAVALSVCETPEGVELKFEDQQIQDEVQRLLTPAVRKLLHEALTGEIPPPDSEPENATAAGNATANATGLGLLAWTPIVTPKRRPVQELPTPGQWKGCWKVEHDCASLRHTLMLQWAALKDSVDEVSSVFADEQLSYERFVGRSNQQLDTINTAKQKYMEQLASAVSSMNMNMDEMNQKTEQQRDLVQEYEQSTRLFQGQITDILYKKVCAFRKVRDHVLAHSAEKAKNITDCDVSDWEPKTGQCLKGGEAITCDDGCPDGSCGGLMEMIRSVVVPPNENGVQCPALTRTRHCGQKKCPRACEVSDWTAWSRCTKDCESGVQTRTRAIAVRPGNGGRPCDALEEQQSCHTGSCDVDCELQDWTEWGSCTTACGGGVSRRFRSVKAAAIGNGRCPDRHSGERQEQRPCHDEECQGDEICVARQDVVLLLDSSRSVTEHGFGVLQRLAVHLAQRYRSRYFGRDSVKVGVVQYGNGDLVASPNSTMAVTRAIEVSPLSSDLKDVVSRIEQLKWKGGFTNLAQALFQAESMITQSGRGRVPSAIIVLSDGKYSFRFQTEQKVKELKSRNVQVYMAPVSALHEKELEQLKKWASQPWSSNYELIPGFRALDTNVPLFAQKLLAKFCPEALSPTLMAQQENSTQYILLKKGAWPSMSCGARTFAGIFNKEDCAIEARSRGMLAFAYGNSHADNRCYPEGMAITAEYWSKYHDDREDPPCPHGEWDDTPFYDTYVVSPQLML